MVTLILVKNAFSPQDGREIKHIEAGLTVAELLEEHAIEGVDLQATVNGYSVEDTTKLNDGDFVVIYPQVEKGGGKGGKGILGIIAAIALSVVSYGIVGQGWLASSGFWAAGHLGAYLAATAVMFIGSSLVGRMMGQGVDTGDYGGKKDNPTYSWGQVQTMEGQNNSIALTYGIVKSGGQTIGKYVNVEDNDEYLNWLIAAGEGPLTITDVKLNDNDVDNFDGVDVEIRKGENDQKVISNFNDTYFTKNTSYKLGEEWTEDSAQGTAIEGLVVDVEFPQGLYHVTDSGDVVEAWITLAIEYKEANGTWTNIFCGVNENNYGVTLNKNTAKGNYTLTLEPNIDIGTDEDGPYRNFYGVDVSIGKSSTYIRTRDIGSKAVTVGSFKVDTSAWSNATKDAVRNGQTITATITVSGGTEIGTITASQNSAVRKQFRVDNLPSGEYSVRAKVVDRQYDEDDTRSGSTCYMTGITSIVYDDFCYPCTALIGIRALATDQLNGSPSLTFLKARPKVWVWNGSSYVEKAANNPAWACYDLLHQARRLKNINTNQWEFEVRGVPANRMRYDDFAAWAAWCDRESYELRVNIEINAVGELLDVVNQKIAPIGRGMVVRFGTKYGCIYDHVQEPVQMFNMGNIIEGSFSEEFLKVSDRANCVEVTFTNADADYQRDTLTIYGETFDNDGYAKTAQVTMDGITDYKQAYREGMYQLMCNKYQLRTVSFEADIDAIASTVGDCILVSHDVPKWANSGRIESVSGNVLRLPVYVSDTSQSYRLQYRKQNDTIYIYPCTINSTSEDGWTTVTLNNVEDSTHLPEVGDVFDLAIATIGSKPFIIKNITRSQEFRRRITCIEYAESLYDETYEIPPIQYATPATSAARNVTKLSAAQFQYTDENRVKHGVMSVSWVRPANGGKFTVLISSNNKKTWTVAVSGTNNDNTEFNVKAKTTYYVKVITVLGVTQSSGVIVGPISPGQDIPPNAITGLTYSIDPADRTKALLKWNPNDDIDFHHYEITVGNVTYRTESDYITITSTANSPTISVVTVDNGGNKSSAVSVVVPIYPYPSNVTGFKATQQATDKSMVEFQWKAVTDSDLSQYELRVGDTWQSATTFAKTKTLKSTYQVEESGTYVFWIAAINAAGNYSNTPTSLTKTISIIPSNVTNFRSTQQITDRSVLEFAWNAVIDTDLAQYEIRQGASWGEGTVIAKTKSLSAIYQVTTSGTYTFWIAAMNAAGVYSEVPTILRQYINIVPSAVTNLTVTQSTKDHSKAVIKFTKSPGEDISYYAIKYGDNWDNGIDITETKENKVEWQVPASGTYNIMVQTVTVAGQTSAIANASITITIEPLDVTGFRATQSNTNKTVVLLTWNPITDPDIAYYVIKKGTTWETGEVIAPRVSGVTYEVVIDDEQMYTWMVKAVTIAGNESQYPAMVTDIFGLEPSKVETIQLRQNPNDRSQLNIQWTEVPDGDLVGYQVKIGSDWNSAEELPLTNELYATYTLTASDTYHVMIKTKNSAGFYSDETSSNITCKVEPTNATNFVAYQNGEEVELYWTKSVDTDVVGYEIREGSSFRNGSLVATGITNNYLVTKVDIERLYQYHIVAINRAGFISDDPKTTRVMVENLPIKNVILTFDEIARQSGTHNNTEFGESLINFQTVGGRFSDYPTTRWTDLGGSDVLKLLKNSSTGKYPTNGIYTLQRIDVGSIITADISVYFVSTVMYTSGVSAILQFRTSLDAVNWIDWMEFKPVQRRFRYAEFRVMLATDDTTRTPEVNHLAISIDVPDTDIAITYSIASGGTTVPYGHTFYTIPNVTASAIGDMLHAVVVSKTKTNCLIKVKNQTNVDTSGTVDLKIKGY